MWKVVSVCFFLSYTILNVVCMLVSHEYMLAIFIKICIIYRWYCCHFQQNSLRYFAKYEEKWKNLMQFSRLSVFLNIFHIMPLLYSLYKIYINFFFSFTIPNILMESNTSKISWPLQELKMFPDFLPKFSYFARFFDLQKFL